MGYVYVTCAVLSNAVCARPKVMVRLPWLYPFVYVHGHVTACIGTFEVGATIFSRGADEPECIPFTGSQEEGICMEFCLPLCRSPLVVPIGSCLRVKGDLVLNGYQTISIDRSIPTDSHFFETDWVEDNDSKIQTDVCLNLRSVWI
jgi:hypothetical protein